MKIFWKAFAVEPISCEARINDFLNQAADHCVKCCNFQQVWKFWGARFRPKLCGDCAFPQNFHTRKFTQCDLSMKLKLKLFEIFKSSLVKFVSSFGINKPWVIRKIRGYKENTTAFHKFYLVHPWILCPIWGCMKFYRIML